VRDQETTSEVRKGREKLKPLIQWLKSKTGAGQTTRTQVSTMGTTLAREIEGWDKTNKELEQEDRSETNKEQRPAAADSWLVVEASRRMTKTL
jgi:hypothetical protein